MVNKMTDKEDDKRAKLSQVYINKLDKIVIAMEEIWFSKEALLDLVSLELQKKFRSAEKKLNIAIVTHKEPEEIAKWCKNIEKGWLALDKEARDSGHQPPKGEYWVAKSESKSRFIIVKDKANKRMILNEEEVKGQPIYTLDELGEILDTLFGINEVKKVFKEAHVTKFEQQIPFDDKIPF